MESGLGPLILEMGRELHFQPTNWEKKKKKKKRKKERKESKDILKIKEKSTYYQTPI
jgi:hypothetical protein